MVLKIHKISPERGGRLWWEEFIEKVSFEFGVQERGIMHCIVRIDRQIDKFICIGLTNLL